jgi:hypothetical protein
MTETGRAISATLPYPSHNYKSFALHYTSVVGEGPIGFGELGSAAPLGQRDPGRARLYRNLPIRDTTQKYPEDKE